MKLLLSITITVKDYFPKEKSIPYDNFICLFTINNFNEKLYFSDFKNKNYINHIVESYDSNLVYNLHIFESIKKSLIGKYQMIINFDKIKNLNVNDILTQQETAKLIIDQYTKRKLFDKIGNVGDINLILSTEIKVIDKKIYSSIKKEISYDNNENISEFNNLTPKTFKRKKIIQTMKNNREALIRIGNIYASNECITDYFKERIDTNKNDVKKHKSLSKGKILDENHKYNELDIINNNQTYNNSCTVIISPKYNNSTYIYNKDNIKKTNRKRPSLMKKRLTITDLISKKRESLFDKYKEGNTFEFNQKYKNISSNNSKNKRKINRKKSKSNSTTKFNIYEKNNYCKVSDINPCKESIDSVRKRVNCNNNNKILVNLSTKHKTVNTVSDRKKKIKSQKKLELSDVGKLDSDIYIHDLMKLQKRNNCCIQTETLSEKAIGRKTDNRKNYLYDPDSRLLLLKKKDISITENNLRNKYYSEMTQGTFSPKMSSKIKINEGLVLSQEKKSGISNKYRKKFSTKILTPKGYAIKKVLFSKEDSLEAENEEIKKKCFNVITLLTEKLKNNINNNKEYCKKLELMKEMNNNLKKYKYKIIQFKNNNESKMIKNHVNFHFAEEKLLNKMINIKLKENNINNIIFLHLNDKKDFPNKITSIISNKKELFLNLIRNIIKYFGNISQLYDKDKTKKQIFQNLLEKYDIKEGINNDVNYLNYFQKKNIFADKIIREVDEDKENEEEYKFEKIDPIRFNNNLIIKKFNLINISNVDEQTINNNIFNEDFDEKEIIKKKIQEIKINNIGNSKNNSDKEYDENLNNLIKKILIEQFPEKYETNIGFTYLEKNKYMFNNKIFHAYIKNNDIILKEEIKGIISNNKLTLNEFYKKYCNQEKIGNNNNFVYTKKIKQKYIKIKTINKEEHLEPESKNENIKITYIEKK